MRPNWSRPAAADRTASCRQPKIEAKVAYQAYVDMDLVDLAEPVATVGKGEAVVPAAEVLNPDDRRLLYAAAGGGAVLLVLLLAAVYRARRSRQRPLRAADVFHLPSEIDGFVVVQLLRALGGSELVRMSSAQRSEMQQDIQRIQASCFGGNGHEQIVGRGTAPRSPEMAARGALIV